MDRILQEKVKKFTGVYHSNEDNQAEPTEIIVVPMGGNLSRGFELARQLLSQNLRVKIIGNGVTLDSAHPAWVREAEHLCLTELGAFHTGKLKETNNLIYQSELAAWLDSILGEVIAGCDTGELFAGTALHRFYSNCDVGGGIPVFYEIVEFHGAKNYYVTSETAGLNQIEHIVALFGGTLKNKKTSRISAMRLRILAQGFVLMTAVALRQIYLYIKEQPSRIKLRELREQDEADSQCSFWAVLLADWKQMNSLLVKSFLLPFLESKKPVGILLTGGLILGATFVDNRTRKRTGIKNWIGLEDIESHLSECKIEQIVSAESVFELLKLLIRFTKKSGAALLRVAAEPTYIGGKFKFDASEVSFDFVKLITHDVFQALSAELAAGKVISRHDFRGATVVFQGSGFMPNSVADVMLQRVGATTVDFLHGVAGTWVGLIPSPSSVREVQIKPESKTNVSPRQKVIVSRKTPPTVLKRTNNRAKARNILFMTSYADRDLKNNNSLPLLPFQEEMLDAVTVIRELFPDRFTFRWRTHPSDWQPAISRTAERVGDIEVSRGRLLGEDLAWADVVISSFSTVLVEALWLEVPIFLHTMPSQADLPAALCFAPSRRFIRSSEIRRGLVECVEKLDAGDPEVLSPERQTRRDWFEIAEEAIEANA